MWDQDFIANLSFLIFFNFGICWVFFFNLLHWISQDIKRYATFRKYVYFFYLCIGWFCVYVYIISYATKFLHIYFSNN